MIRECGLVGRVENMAMAQDTRTLHLLLGPVYGEQSQQSVFAVTHCYLVHMILLQHPGKTIELIKKP